VYISGFFLEEVEEKILKEGREWKLMKVVAFIQQMASKYPTPSK